MASDATSGPSTGRTSVARLLAAIGYPERMSGGSAPFTLRVDGAEVVAEEMNGRLVLSCVLTGDDSLLPVLATYAAGRMMKEKAVLAYGNHPACPPSARPVFLWQDAPADADSHDLLRLFETFMNSCDWWRTRIEVLRGEATAETAMPETMMIRP